YGFTLTARKTQGPLRAVGSWTISRTEGTINAGTPELLTDFTTNFLDNPAQVQYYKGPLSEDRQHVVRLLLSYDITDSLLVGGAFSYLTGAPYSKLYFNTVTNGYNDYRAQRGLIPN